MGELNFELMRTVFTSEPIMQLILSIIRLKHEQKFIPTLRLYFLVRVPEQRPELWRKFSGSKYIL